MSLLTSPRRRRRLAWLAGVLGGVVVVVVVVALLPSHGGPAKGVRIAPHAPTLGGRTQPTFVDSESPAAARARKKAEAVVRPLATRFVDDLLHRRDLT
jgi:hypothetical protein